MYQLRPYQSEAVNAVISHFRSHRDPALIVLPTGAGKSLVIAELARLAKGRVLALAHVKELVEQNHGKYESYGLQAGIFAAGLKRKDQSNKVIFGSIQSVARAPDEFFDDFSLLIIDEAHRIPSEQQSQYQNVISKLQNAQAKLCILGLTATPYRLDTGWIFEYHYRGFVACFEPRFFKRCIYELPLRYMIDQGYLTQPIQIDAPVACYDFSELRRSKQGGSFAMADIASTLSQQKRVTPGIVGHIQKLAVDRQGVMIFSATVEHAKEILALLPEDNSAIILGDTEHKERDRIIQEFKQRRIKYLVNVSVLTTGFDAPHVDLIAVLRPTESVSLFQQIVGRGLRLSEDKTDCLILDYTGQGFDIFQPEIDQEKPDSDAEIVEVACPICEFKNQFWGYTDGDGHVIEHFGRKCKGAQEDPVGGTIIACSYRFRFKVCEQCGAENDIAARICHHCQSILVDADSKLRKAMELRDAHVMRPDTMIFSRGFDKKKRLRLEIAYYDVDANVLKEFYYLESQSQIKAFYYNFARMHHRMPGQAIHIHSVDDAIAQQQIFRMPHFIIARKKSYYWQIRDKIF